MRCEEAAPGLLDDRARLDAELESHASQCERCRSLVAADRVARSLGRHDPVPALPALRLEGEIVRRRRVRVAFASAVALVLVAGTGVLPRRSAFVRPAADFAPLEATEVDSVRGRKAFALAEIDADNQAWLRRELSVEDATYASFGDLPRWVAPPRNRALESPVFRKALHTLNSNPR